MMIGSTEALIIFGTALILFGPSRLPQLGSAIGETVRNFRKGINGLKEEESEQPKSIPTEEKKT